MNNPTVGHYEILGQLGQGGMGIVHLALDTKLNRRVALKVLPAAMASTPEARQRFRREAQSASALNSPHIVTIYEIGTDGETDFIAMEYVRGETLADLLKKGPLSVETALRYAAQAAAALTAAHGAGIMHRDLKPGNIMVGPDGLVKVLDFGLAKAVEASSEDSGDSAADTRTTPLTQHGLAIGTLAYMSPEQALGSPLDFRSDLFSFGLILYEMFAGVHPFSSPAPADTFRRIQLEDPPPPSKQRREVTRALDRIILKALAKKPEDRHTTAQEMEAELKGLLPGSGSHAAPAWRSMPGVFPDSWARLTSRRSLSLLAAGILVALLAVWQPWRTPHEPTPSAVRWFEQGTAAIRDGTYHTASLALERAIAADPAYALARIRLADTYFELDSIDKAKEQLLGAVPDGSAANLSKIDELYLEAARLTLTANFEAAAQVYATIRDKVPTPDRPSALVDYGRALERAENIKAAMVAYEEAARMEAQYPSAFLRLGILHRRRLDQAKAGEAFRQAESLYRSLGNMEGIAEVNYQRGVLLNNLGNAREAKAILDQALEMARTAGNEQQQIAILLQLSGVMHRLDGPVGAGEYASQAINLAREKGLEPLAARGLIDLGNSYFAGGDPAEARRLFTQALETARRNRNRRTEARALLSLGSLDVQQGNYAAGLKNVDSALAFYRQGSYRKETSQGLLLSGRARRSMGDYEGAYKAFEEQHRRGLEVGDLEQVQLSLEAMGLVRLLDGRYPDALKHFQDAVASNSNSAGSVAGSYTRLNCANALWRLGRYDEAEKLISPIEAALQDKPNKGLSFLLAETRAAIALSRRQFPAVIAIASRTLAEPGLSPSAAVSLRVLRAFAEAHSGQSKQAVQTAREAVDAANATGLPDLIAGSLAIHSLALLSGGDPAGALERAKEAMDRNTAALNRERQWRILTLAARAEAASGRPAQAAGFAASAAQALSSLEKLYGPDGFAAYARRPDIIYESGTLSALRKPANNPVRLKGTTE